MAFTSFEMRKCECMKCISFFF